MGHHVQPRTSCFQAISAITSPYAMHQGIYGKICQSAVGTTGKPFWQYESYDHCIRNLAELNRAIRYVDSNPVRAGLVSAMTEWPWSSAREQAKGLLHRDLLKVGNSA
jgi:hypothetical protein